MTLIFDESETLSVVSELFSKEFEVSFSTKLIGGADEPLYLPKNRPGGFSLLKFRSDFVSSALHEISHWCIAGERRRKLKDFGYWYCPDGRSEVEQEAFEWPGKTRHFAVGPAWIPWASQEVQKPVEDMPRRYEMAVFDLYQWNQYQADEK